MRILIVDDEALIRFSLRKYMEQNGISHDDILEASKASEMQSVLQQEKIDVLFIDVRMPGIDGLEAIAANDTFLEGVSVYVVSGYSDFSYAQRALRLKVNDYLLKPIPQETIRDILRKESERLRQQESDDKERQLQDLKTFIETDQPVKEPAAAILFYIPNGICVDDTGITEKEILSAAAEAGNHVSVLRKDKSLIALLPHDDLRVFIQKMESVAAGRQGWTGFVDEEYFRKTDGNVTYDMYMVLAEPPGRIYFLWKDVIREKQELYSLFKACRNIMAASANADYAGFVNASKLFCQHYPLIDMQSIPSVAGYFTKKFRDQFGLQIDLRNSNKDNYQKFQEYAIHQYLKPTENESGLLSTIKAYIDGHFSENLSVQQLGADFGLAPNYLSNQFKKIYHIGLIQYLTNLRINHAQKLLIETNMSIQEVSEACGYPDAAYFSKVFFRAVSMSPIQFRREKRKS